MNIPTLNNTIIPDGIPRVSECMDQLCTLPPKPKTSIQGNSLPLSFDLRVKYPGLIGDALSQGECSACWAYATATAFGDRIRIFSKGGTSTTKFMEDLSNGNMLAKWVEYDIKPFLDKEGKEVPLLRGNVKIPYRLYDNVVIGNRVIPGIVMKDVMNTLSPTYLAACDVCELPFELNGNSVQGSKVAQFLRSKGVQCSSCCSGGFVMYAHLFLVLNGVISLACDPLPDKFVCSSWTGCIGYRAKSVYKVSLTSYTSDIQIIGNTRYTTQRQVPLPSSKYQENMRRIMQNIYDHGTVAASMETYGNFQDPSYDGGKGYSPLGNGLMLYHTKAGPNTGGHAVCIVGWGEARTSDGRIIPYWICRNSWGTRWLSEIKPKGQKDLNQGYFAILRGVNLCNIEDDVYGAEPFQVYDILQPNGQEKLLPESQRPKRTFLESLPCKGRPVTKEGNDDVQFVDNCSECKKGDSMCLQVKDNTFTVCSYRK